MNKYLVKGKWYTVNELSEMSGLLPHTIRDRLRRGFSVEEAIKPVATLDSVKEFCDASHYEDWIGMRVEELYGAYWNWCMKEHLQPCSKHQFGRQIFQSHPFLHSVPMKGKRYVRKKYLDNLM